MKLWVKNFTYAGICVAIALVGNYPAEQHHYINAQSKSKQALVSSQHHRHHSTKHVGEDMRTPIDWHKSSETVPYPDVNKTKNLWVKVSLTKNRTYLYDGKKLLYTMYSTGGMYKKDHKTGKRKSMTPTGTYYIQAERGDSFYNQELGEGANYYVSWLNHGEYLFHSVPTMADGSYNQKEARKLGKSTGSHGCIRLSIPDAKWMSTNLPVGTKVKIVN